MMVVKDHVNFSANQWFFMNLTAKLNTNTRLSVFTINMH